MRSDLETWEAEGGALRAVSSRPAVLLRGSLNHVEWAERIRCAVDAEFDRAANALLSATSKQSPENQCDARAVISILEEKRTEVMAIKEAGYFIREWQELDGRVRRLIAKDDRYAAIRAKRAERRTLGAPNDPGG